MTEDDRNSPERVTNTAILNQVGNPPPPTVLAAVLAATGGAAPHHVAALPKFGDRDTTWRVLGCTGSTVFEVDAHKDATDWHGSRSGASTNQETLTVSVRPLRDVARLAFELETVYRDDGFGRPSIQGTWRVTYRSGGETLVPTDGREQIRYALAGIVEAIRAAL